MALTRSVSSGLYSAFSSTRRREASIKAISPSKNKLCAGCAAPPQGAISGAVGLEQRPERRGYLQALDKGSRLTAAERKTAVDKLARYTVLDPRYIDPYLIGAMIMNVEAGHRVATLCHLGNIARRLGRRLKWDPVKEIFPDDEEAIAFLPEGKRRRHALDAVAAPAPRSGADRRDRGGCLHLHQRE